MQGRSDKSAGILETPETEGGVQLVSVIIPAFNAVETLPSCLSALLASDYPSVECIVVNDGSSDQTSAVARSFSKVRVIDQPNAGSAAAKNRGASEARGDFLYFLDSDVIVEPRTISQMVDTARRYKADLVVGRYSTRPMNNGLVHHYKAVADYIQYVTPEGRTQVRLNHQLGGGGDFISRLAFERVGRFDERYKGASVEREELYLRFYRAGYQSAANPFIKTRHYFPNLKGLIKSYITRIYGTVQLLQRGPNVFTYISIRNALVTPVLGVLLASSLILWLAGVVPGLLALAMCAAFVWGSSDFLRESIKRKGVSRTIILLWLHWLICCIIATSGAVSMLLVLLQRRPRPK